MRFSILFIICLFLTSCAQLTRLDTGRTVGKGNIELGGFISLYGLDEAQSQDLGGVGLPLLGFQTNYGITDRIDINASFNSAGNMYLNPKFQVVGDQESPFALSLLPGGDIQIGDLDGSENPVIFRAHMSAIASFHIDEWAAFFEPKYVYQDITQTHFVGATVGLEYKLNNRSDFALGYSYFPVLGTDLARGSNIYNIGFSFMRTLR